MNIDEQIQLLITNAPQDGITGRLVEAIAPGLKLLAQKLCHWQYYILQSLEQEWVVTTLSDRAHPNIEKSIIYAFPSLQDASDGSISSEIDPQVIAVPIPVTHILFQLATLKTVDSIIFFETSGDLAAGTEIQREDVQNLIQIHLQQKLFAPRFSPQVPPDIA